MTGSQFYANSLDSCNWTIASLSDQKWYSASCQESEEIFQRCYIQHNVCVFGENTLVFVLSTTSSEGKAVISDNILDSKICILIKLGKTNKTSEKVTLLESEMFKIEWIISDPFWCQRKFSFFTLTFHNFSPETFRCLPAWGKPDSGLAASFGILHFEWFSFCW